MYQTAHSYRIKSSSFKMFLLQDYNKSILHTLIHNHWSVVEHGTAVPAGSHRVEEVCRRRLHLHEDHQTY